MCDFNLTIDTGNAAFGPTATDRNSELARMLRGLADKLDGDPREDASGRLHDANGNGAGTWSLAAFDHDQHGADDVADLLPDVAELACSYGRGTAGTVYTYPAGMGLAWYAVAGSVNVNCADEDELFDGVDVEGVEDVDTFTAGQPINSPEAMARACRDV